MFLVGTFGSQSGALYQMVHRSPAALRVGCKLFTVALFSRKLPSAERMCNIERLHIGLSGREQPIANDSLMWTYKTQPFLPQGGIHSVVQFMLWSSPQIRLKLDSSWDHSFIQILPLLCVSRLTPFIPRVLSQKLMNTRISINYVLLGNPALDSVYNRIMQFKT